jgi:hypothetical protein
VYRVDLTLASTNKLLVQKPILNAYFSLSKRVHPYTCIFAYLSGFKKGGAGLGRRAGGVCNLICRSLFHYYSDYSTSTFLLSVCFLPCVLPSLCVLLFPLCASSICFLLRETGDFVRENREGGLESVRINRLIFYVF